MSSADNRKLLKDMFAGLANRDSTLFLDGLADDVTWSIIGSNSWSGAYTGKERGAARPADAAAKPARGTVEDRRSHAIVDGDVAASRGAWPQRDEPERPTTTSTALVFRFAGNRKIVDVVEYSDTELIAKALTDRTVSVAAMG